jgi:hypothetical protein
MGKVVPFLLILAISGSACRRSERSAEAATQPMQHPTATSLRERAGIPKEFIATSAGYFHPSCVLHLGCDEELAKDLTILNKSTHKRRPFPKCGYPHYALSGIKVTDGTFRPLDSSAFTNAQQTSTAFVNVGASWNVPENPTNYEQMIVLWNGLETQSNVLQPTLTFDTEINPLSASWWVAGGFCCAAGIMITAPDFFYVNVGDEIYGSISGSGCDPAGSGQCNVWTVTATDVTTNQISTLSVPDGWVQSPLPYLVDVMEQGSAGGDCNQYPESATQFINNVIYGPAGAISPNFQQANNVAGSCGWSVQISRATVWIMNPQPKCDVRCSCGKCAASESECSILCNPCSQCKAPLPFCCNSGNGSYCSRLSCAARRPPAVHPVCGSRATGAH